jgi:hypothetical protein
MGDAHSDLERSSRREHSYRMYLKELKNYLANPTSNNYDSMMQKAGEGVDFIMLEYWMNDFDYEKTIGKNVEQKIESLLKRDEGVCEKFLDSIVWYQTRAEYKEFDKILKNSQ